MKPQSYQRGRPRKALVDYVNWNSPEPRGVDTLWKDYKFARTQGDGIVYRNRIVEKYLPFVRSLAERIYARLPGSVELDDLVSSGVIGLMDAAESFDLTKGVKFETYATPRIRGEIFDDLRRRDPISRLTRTNRDYFKEAKKNLRARKMRQVSPEEVENEIRRLHLELAEDIILEKGDKYLAIREKLESKEKKSLSDNKVDAEVRRLYCSHAENIITTFNKPNPEPISLDKEWGPSDSVLGLDPDTEGKAYHSLVEDKKTEDPSAKSNQRDNLTFILSSLNRKERLIIIFYYYHELTMKEIGKRLDISESRVSQMHSELTERLGNISSIREYFGIRSDQ